MLLVRLLGPRELDQLNFLELVLADDAAHVLAIRTGFAAEAGRVSGDGEREARGVNGLVAIEVGERHFRGGNEPEIVIFDLERIAGKLWQLAGAVHGS